MSESAKPTSDLRSEEHQSVLFASLITQQMNMALMCLGKVPHPETGKPAPDLEAARFCIDQLAVLEAKTKGNLTKMEEGLLKQSLMALRLAYVEAVEKPPAAPPASEPEAQPPSTNAGEAKAT